MPHTLFISDLHLSEDEPHITQLFLNFTRNTAPKADALYILGDLFEYWAGDDDRDSPFHQEIISAMRDVSLQGTPVFVMHGNRDFLMDEGLAQECNARLLPDPTLIDLYGTPTLLTHGDALCTDDKEYQAFRKQVRQPAWRSNFLAQPLIQRKAQIEQLRKISEGQKQTKAMDIMDVNPSAVADLFRSHHYPRMIHGHTHRQKHHLHEVDGKTCERWVLGDWHKTGNSLRCDKAGCSFQTIR
ncbi:MAG TPA: UDP-2,3-diacylglucosamine diphosphatase [Gallionellaceae bacterium]|nr:UDP-2,3-diacylglucosamine diphosphatase [Gallionellaceae bacterium]